MADVSVHSDFADTQSELCGSQHHMVKQLPAKVDVTNILGDVDACRNLNVTVLLYVTLACLCIAEQCRGKHERQR